VLPDTDDRGVAKDGDYLCTEIVFFNACCFVIGIVRLRHHSTHVTAKLIFIVIVIIILPLISIFVFVTVVTLQISRALMTHGETTQLFKLQHDW